MHLPNDKLLTLPQAVEARKALKAAGKTMVMTNGCFDLLHVGHISYMQKAKALGDELWVLINSDDSVRALKGPTRPIESESERAFCLAALSCIDCVVVFNTPRITEEIKLLSPDIYTKAGDYTIDTLHQGERQAFESVGTEIRFLPFLEGFSTTKMIEKIHKAGSL
ncbi:MAG TPA: ADP-heptose synthase [Opitutae bacterium]|nr:ADP-heptose synthase [Opitutae bacterium]